MSSEQKAKIGLIFSHRPSNEPTWPYKGYDYDTRINTITNLLKEALPNIEFIPKIVHNRDEAKETLEALKNEGVDGFVAYIVGIWTGVPGVIAKSGIPTIMVDDLYGGSGEFLGTLAEAKKQNLKVIGVASSDFKEVVKAIGLFNVIRAMKETRIVDIVDSIEGGVTPLKTHQEKIKEVFGTEVIVLDSKTLRTYYDKVDEKEAIKWAEKWISEALRVVEPSRDEIIKSARMYLALKSILTDNNAQAVTVDCLGLFYTGKLPAYPCLSHFQMNNEGLTGVCEADLDSTLTQLLIRYLNGTPGYVSDPVIDTASNQVIYAHCVANNRVFGPNSLPNPYIIRSHAEDGEGASIQSIMPLGKIVTTIKVNTTEKAMAIHQGRAVANVEEEKACRTKLAVETDAKTILENWNKKFNFGWHRVSFYGDIREEVVQLSSLLGLEVFEEDRR
jgi:L-fucose isomerase-like protein